MTSTMKIQTVSTERIRRLFDIVPSLLEVMVLMLCFLLSTEVTTVFAFHANRMVGVKYQQSSFTRNDDTIFVTCRKNECKQLKLFATTTTTKLPEDHRVMIPTIGDESGVFEEAKSSRLLNLDGNTYIPLISTSKIDLFDLCNSDVAADSSVVEKSRLLAKYKRQLEKYITSNQHDDVDRAERLLDTMIEINRKYKIDNPQDESVGSNRNGAVVFFDITELTVAHNKVLTYWKKNFKTRPDAAYRIEKLLKKMAKENIANHISYTAYIGMLADQGDPLSAQRAQDIAEYMLASYQPQQQKLTVQNDLKPNSQTWNSEYIFSLLNIVEGKCCVMMMI